MHHNNHINLILTLKFWIHQFCTIHMNQHLFQPNFCLEFIVEFGALPNKFIIFNIALLYYYINLRSSVILCLSSTYIYILLMFNCTCFWVILLQSFWNFYNYVNNFIINQIISCSCCFLNCFSWSSFKCICCRLLSMIKKFLTAFIADVFTYVFTYFLPIFLAKDKNP